MTERQSDGVATRIVGVFEHNSECRESALNRVPAVPLHEHVYEVALEQLSIGARYDPLFRGQNGLIHFFCSITAILDTNRQMVENNLYRGMEQDLSMANFRYHFLPRNNSALYQKFSRKLGIDVKQLPQYNLDDWLNPQSRKYIPAVAEAIFYYHARAEQGPSTSSTYKFQAGPASLGSAWHPTLNQPYAFCPYIFAAIVSGACFQRDLAHVH